MYNETNSTDTTRNLRNSLHQIGSIPAFGPVWSVVSVNDGEKSKYGWVFLVYGNDGWDVVSDYTTNLESVLRPVFDLIGRIDEAVKSVLAGRMTINQACIALRGTCTINQFLYALNKTSEERAVRIGRIEP